MYVIKQTGIAVNFGISVLLGFVIGTAIAGQTFYNFTTRTFATSACSRRWGRRRHAAANDPAAGARRGRRSDTGWASGRRQSSARSSAAPSELLSLPVAVARR